MTTSYLKACVEARSYNEFEYCYELPGAENCYATAKLDLREEEHGWRNFGNGWALDLLKFCEEYNSEADDQVLELNLYRCYGNSNKWELYERDVREVNDELRRHQFREPGEDAVCLRKEDDNVHSCLPYELDRQRKVWLENADDYEDETSRKAYIEGVDRMFRKIDEELVGVDKERKVIVWDSLSLDPFKYDIVDRCPDSWNDDCYYYRYYLEVCDGYEEDGIENLGCLAWYLNSCLDKSTDQDPCLFVEEWCDEHDCIFNPGDPSYEFSARFDLEDDWVWDRNNNELLRIDYDEDFVVVDLEEEDCEE